MTFLWFVSGGAAAEPFETKSWTIDAEGVAGSRSYTLRSDAKLRDGIPYEGARDVKERPDRPWVETGSSEVDGLYALALAEAAENSVDEITDKSYRNGQPLPIHAFQTGRLWRYVWTRDLAYACDLGLARFDPSRAVSSLRFKVSQLKPGLAGVSPQIIQDVGSGGSYPVSTDRVVWALGARAAVRETDDASEFLRFAHEALTRTLEQDYVLVRDPADGLFRGEASFLDWREQTYPEWTARDVLPIARSKALSTNVLYFAAMQTAFEFAQLLGRGDEADRWRAKAESLRVAIRNKFFTTLPPAAFILCGETSEILSEHRDLLGESLAIIHGIAGPDEARHLSKSYPHGPHGPSVVWPNARGVPIYHNLGIWPFVTAYYMKAASAAGNEEGVARAFRSLLRGAAANLSNMENLDWASGAASGSYQGLEGPVINSQRQLWSVAGFLAAVQDVLFGFGATNEGVTVSPCIPRALKEEFFPGERTICLRNLTHRGQRHDIVLHIPDVGDGDFRLESVTLNGAKVSPGPVPYSALAATNSWEVQFSAGGGRSSESLRTVSPADDVREVFSPRTPYWRDEGVRVVGSRSILSFGGAEDGSEYRIYRDGKIVASEVTSTEWEDPEPENLTESFFEYAVAVLDPMTGNVSHPSTFRRAVPAESKVTADFAGGASVVGLDIPRDGNYIVAFRYANGAGEIGTGITCGVRFVEVADETGKFVHSGYALFPQTGGSLQFRRSSSLIFSLRKGRHEIRLSGSTHALNMSYMAANEDFTEFAGGGKGSFDELSLKSVTAELR